MLSACTAGRRSVSKKKKMAASTSLQPKESPTAVSEIESLEPRLPLQTLQTHLQTLSETLSTTLSQTTDFPDLQTRLQTSAISTAHLLERTRTTLSLFQSATQKNIDDVTLTRRLLSKNYHTPAQSILSKSTASNTRLAKTSYDLALAFESAASDLAHTLAEAHNTEQSQRAKIEHLRQTTDAFYANLSRARHEHDEAFVKFSDASELYDAAQRREDSAQRLGKALRVAHVATVVASIVTTRTTAAAMSLTGVAALAATSEQHAARAREERAVHLRHKRDARDEKSAAGTKVAEIGESIRCMKRESAVTESVLEGLEKCVMVLRELAGVMVVVEGFWKDVRERVDAGVVELVAAGVELPEEERTAFWEGDAFRSRLEQVVDFWTAVGVVCQRGLDGVDRIAICDGTDVSSQTPSRLVPVPPVERLLPEADGRTCTDDVAENSR